MAAVRFDHISKVFDDGTQAVTDFNLDINDGELVVLVGPSGCGKSTLLRMLAGLETVSEGELLIDDQVINTLTPQQRNIAMVFQNYALYPHMSVRRNLEFPLSMMQLDKQEIQTRVNDVAELLGLTALLERKPKQLSGGQRQRVAMGRAIVRRPQVFLMDEPLSNLDAKLRLQLRSEIAALQRRMQTTMLYVTHDQVEAMTLGDRVAVLNQGQLQQVAEPQVLYEHPANIFVAGFIGNPGMNIFKTELVQNEAKQLALQWGENKLVLPFRENKVQTLQHHIGKPLFAGLRPEAIHTAGNVESDAIIHAEIESIEALGHEYLLYFRSDVNAIATDHDHNTTRSTMVARLAYRPPAGIGETIELGLNLKQLYLFHGEGSLLADSTV
jgi:multiple sugar transport system ATP-binding protein